MREDSRRSGWNPTFKAAALAACLLFAARSLAAGSGVVNVNQHRVPVDGCGPGTALPFDIINSVGINSFHVSSADSQYDCAVSGYENRSRPSIFSDDWKYPDASDKQKWFTRIAGSCTYANNNSGANRGRRHYEHYQPDLERLLDWGGRIESLRDFPGWPTGDRYTAYGFLDEMGRSNAGYANGCAGMGNGGTVSRLTQNGAIGIGVTPSGDRILWNGQNATLIGYGAMGAAAAAGGGAAFSDAYFRVLRHFYVNLTRVWLVEQWTTLAVCASPRLDRPMAFSGSMALGYDLSMLNPKYWNRLRAFVQEAADRGIAVQMSLFDRYSVIENDLGDANCRGEFNDSPFRDLHNAPQTYLADVTCNATCLNDCQSTYDAAVPTESPDDSCNTCDQHAHGGFTNPEWVDPGGHPNSGVPTAIHEAFVDRAVQEVGGIGNVIFEIINEGRKDCDWYDSPDSDGIGDRNETWQDMIAKRVRSKLPIWVGRDAFNKAENALAGQPTDIAGQMWQMDQTHNAQVWNHIDCEYVPSSCTPQQIKTCSGGGGCTIILKNANVNLGSASAATVPTNNDILGTIAVPAQPLGTNFSVRADVVRNQGSFAIGFKTASDEQVFVELGPPTGAGTHRIALVQVVAGQTTELSSTDIGDADNPLLANVRLEIANRLLMHGSATVFFDGAPVAGMTGVGLSFYSIPDRAFFRGTKDQNPWMSSYGSVDNFEVDAVCGDESFCPVIAVQDGFETGNFDRWTTATGSGSNTMSVTTAAHLTGSYGAQVNVSQTGTNPVYVEFDNLSADDTTAKFGWSMNLQALNAPDPGSLGSRNFRFLSVIDSTQSKTLLIFFAQRQSTAPGNWRLVAWAWDTASGQYVTVGSLYLFAYHSPTTRQIECTWVGGTPGSLTCTNLGNSDSFSSSVNQEDLHLDVFRLGFFDYDSFGQNAGGAAYFDDITVYSPFIQEGWIPPP